MDMSEGRCDGPPIAGWQAFVMAGSPPTGQAVDKIKHIREAGPGRLGMDYQELLWTDVQYIMLLCSAHKKTKESMELCSASVVS